ncbi:hypothetical protein HK104_007762, partial [Borealophlyctis nickersoniae]
MRKLSGVVVEAEDLFDTYFANEEASFCFTIKYDAAARSVTTLRPSGGRLKVDSAKTLGPGETFFRTVDQILEGFGDPTQLRMVDDDGVEVFAPFSFACGLVGYLGYEMKVESMATGGESSRKNADDGKKGFRHFGVLSAGTTPDAAFILADQVVVFDHIEETVYLLALQSREESTQLSSSWMDSMVSRIAAVAGRRRDTTDDLARIPRISDLIAEGPANPSTPNSLRNKRPSPSWTLSQQRKTYIQNIQTALSNITDGETYEVCLTTQIKCCLPDDGPPPWEAYRHLRRRNPAPYSAFLNFGSGLALTSSSPERFLQVEKGGWVNMKPIKGTMARAAVGEGRSEEEVRKEDERIKAVLVSNEKDRAENLMIVDLIRNDLNLISEPQSVHVPALMQVESYATVHQLVSTIRGKLRGDLTAVDAVMRSFPPGSMTGAPKLRTVEILEKLEGEPRGPYSGVLGYFSLAGTAEFSVVIRTAVFAGQEVSIGAGGAIVALSDAEAEFEEMVLKANSVLPRRQLTIEEAVSPHNASIETVETVETTSSTFALAPTSPTTAPSTTVSTPLTVTTTTSAIPTVTETQVRYYRLLASHLIRSTLSGTLTDAIKVAADHFGIQGQESTPGLLSIYQRLNTGASHYDTPNPPANTGVTLFDLQESVRGGKGLVRIWGQRGTLHLYDRRDWPVVCAASGEKVIGWRMASVKGGNVTGRDSSKELGEARKRVRDLLSQGETVSKAIFDSLGYPPKLSYSVFMCATLEGHGSRGLDEGGSVMLPREVVAPAAKVPWTTPTHAEALLIAARRYFKTYGPAKEEDFRYWMNLSAAESKSTISTLRESNELV